MKKITLLLFMISFSMSFSQEKENYKKAAATFMELYNKEDYYVFGKGITAPCDAKVVQIITDVKDNIPGELNPKQLTGDTVVLETANKEFILMAHFKEKSIVVREGQQVKVGQLLGQCGNSGNTTEAHLHLSLQNVKNMNEATGGKIFFEKIKVNGEIKEDYLPVKNDEIQNIKR